MEDIKIISLTILFLSFGYLSNQLVPDSSTSSSTTAAPAVLVCVNAQQDGKYTQALSCINGRRMAGCCVDRMSCNFNTSSIDLTMYGPVGYRSPCANTYVCCPLQFVIPIVIDSKDDSDEELSKEFDDVITDADV